jgi:hypothetical protein
MARTFLASALVAGLCAGCCANAPRETTKNSGNMLDLGYPEPYWYPISQGSAAAPAVVPKPSIQVWGDIMPGTKGASVCKYSEPPAGSPPAARGSCRTDISWITASANLKDSIFDDPVFNYILRYQLYGACYRSTQARPLFTLTCAQ